MPFLISRYGNKSSGIKSMNFYCESCNYFAGSKYNYNKHITTAKHQKCQFGNKTLDNSGNFVAQKYSCLACDYHTTKKTHFNAHVLTAKHIGNAMAMKQNKKVAGIHECSDCNKSYSNASGLWKHRKTCSPTNNTEQTYDSTTKTDPKVISAMLDIMQRNSDMQNILIEQNQELQNTLKQQNTAILEKLTATTLVQNNYQTNTTNNQFQLNVFLNEHCKDAINITDFVNSIKLQVSDFEETGRIGYVEGITKILLKSLKEYDINKRPMHCTDIKRETIYIKNNDVWEKEESDKKYMKWAVEAVAQLNLNQHKEWQRQHPDCTVNNSQSNHEFMKLTSVALGGHANNEEDKYVDKIMKNVLKEVTIRKPTVSRTLPLHDEDF